jgi:hypothetical protein
MLSVPEIDIHTREFVKTNEKLGSFKARKDITYGLKIYYYRPSVINLMK